MLRVFKEIKGVSPSKGMFPFSTDWFITWQQNIHFSLFFNIYMYLLKNTEVRDREALIKAYSLYLEQIPLEKDENPILSFTRAWTLLKFMDSEILTMALYTKCGGHFIIHKYALSKEYICGLCEMLSRAGKTKKAKELAQKIYKISY